MDTAELGEQICYNSTVFTPLIILWFIIVYTEVHSVCQGVAKDYMDSPRELYWDSTYAIVVSLMENYPTLTLETIGQNQLASMVVALPGFQDDPDLVTEQFLLDILTVWYEEATPL
ncbi:MAG: Fe-S cluster assembly protein IscX [Chloroflexota bacterium]